MTPPKPGSVLSSQETGTPDRPSFKELGRSLEAVCARKRLVLLVFAASLLIGGLVNFFIPISYESTVSIIAPKEASGGLATALALKMFGAQLPSSPSSLTPNRDLFISILKSETLAMNLVEAFKLKERYRSKYLSEAVDALKKRTRFVVSREGVISITVLDSDRQLAADMASFYATNLDRILARFSVTEASKQKQFISKRLEETSRDLNRAEEALREFQEKNKAISLTDQAKIALESAARLKGDIIASEVQLEVLRNFAGEGDRDILQLKGRIEELNRQLAGLDVGKLKSALPKPDAIGPEVQLTFSEFPELGLEMARLLREVKVQETVYFMLTQQIEEAKIAEARDLPTVQVLDRPIPAEKRSRPRVLFNIGLSGFCGLALGIFLAILLEMRRLS